MSARPPRPRDPLIGREVARCVLERSVGGGATAVVYRGRHTGLGIPVAVKILRPKAAADPVILESFRREGRAIARLDDENVLKVYDVVDDGDLHCMVMELLEGESVLDRVTEQGQLRVIDTLRILRQVAMGLSAAHAQGIVHRDVKPANFVLLPNGSLKLVDFGLAAEQAATGKRVGTPHYMAPETCATGHSEPASDVYSLGIAMYHMLVGQPPHAGRSMEQILRAHRDGAPMDLEAGRPGLGAPVHRLFESLTAHDAAKRPTATEVVGHLDRIGGKRLLRPLRRRSSENVGARVAVGALLLGVAAGAWWFLGRDRGDDEPETEPAPRAEAPPVVEVPPPEPEGPDEDELALIAQTEAEAEALLRGVEAWARKNWRARSDTARVVKRYENIGGPYTDTPAGIEAARRIEAIEAGRLHPHPDRSWSSAEEIAAARDALAAGSGTVARLIAAHRYLDAKAALPAAVSDPDGTLETRLAAEHAYLDALAAFPTALAARLQAAPDASRELVTKQGTGTLTAIGDGELKVELGGETKTLAWPEVAPKAVARLALRAFDGAPSQDVLPLLAFCVAHGLEASFWEASLGVDLAGRPIAEENLVRDLEARLSSR